MRCVIVDLDGTLADCSHRLHYVTGENRDWNRFFGGMADDPVIEPIRDLVKLLAHHVGIVFCSGRPENYRPQTEAWLRDNEIFGDGLYMRPAGDTRPDYVVKAQLLEGIRADGYDPWLVIDDRPSVVAMWREHELTCLQCRDWEERGEIEPGILTVMVGPSGAGKTTWLKGTEARALGIRSAHVLSSDQIREDLCGDFRSQEKNAQTFAALHAQAKARLRNGLPTVVDATNLRRKDRLAVVACSPPGGKVRYVVIDRPIEEKRRDAGWRGAVRKDGNPFDLVGKHAQTFASQLKDILAGDGLPHVEVIDRRSSRSLMEAA